MSLSLDSNHDGPVAPNARVNRRRRLGEMLVAQGIISPDQLNEVLELQRTEKTTRIGQLLIELGYVTELQLTDLIADQLRLPSADLTSIEISPDAVARVPRELAIKHRCLPWMIQGRDLLLVTADPTDVSAIDAIGFATGLRVKPVVAAESEVVAAIERCYAADEAGPEATFERVELADQFAIIDDIEGESAGGAEEDLERAAQAGPVIKLVNSILADAIASGASDIHIEPQQKGVNLRYRIDGALRHIVTMPKRSQAKIVSRIKIAAHMDIAERRLPQDGRTRTVLAGRSYDLRVSTLPTADGEKAVIRILEQDRAKIALEDLGFEDDTLETFRALLRRPQGLILVTGPTGSGKTSTLYAALNFLTAETTNIVTIEDPIEYRLAGINQVAVSDRAGLTFATGLRSILRQDPNVVMVGEIRDLETAQVAFHAAQTGHLVLSTLHTNDAPGAVTRLVEMGVPAYLVASSAIAVQAQRLVRRLCSCKAVQPDGTATPNGCEHCRFTGYKGRMAVHELLPLTPRVRTVLLSQPSSDPLRMAARSNGMRTMFEDGQRKVARGLTTVEELMRVVPPPEEENVAEADNAEAEAGASPVSAESPRAARPPRALIIDTDEASARSVQNVLTAEHFDTFVARTPQEGLAVVYRESPDLILADVVGTPGSDGLDLLRKLKGRLATCQVPVVMLSSVGHVQAEVRALDAGAEDFLRKPIDPNLLLSRIRRALLRSSLAGTAPGPAQASAAHVAKGATASGVAT
jgi:type IV pilus assembly protein PilB